MTTSIKTKHIALSILFLVATALPSAHINCQQDETSISSDLNSAESYELWKKEILQDFNKQGLTLFEQKEFLRHWLFLKYDILNAQELAKSLGDYYLRHYYLLRELVGDISGSFSKFNSGSGKTNLDKADIEWLYAYCESQAILIYQDNQLQETSYKLWREVARKEFAGDGSFSLPVLLHIKAIQKWFKLQSVTSSKNYSLQTFFAYNSLREYMLEPVIHDYSQIDFTWLEDIEKCTLKFYLENNHSMSKPNSTQQALFEYAKKLAGIENDITLLSTSHKYEAVSTGLAIGIPDYPDLDHSLFLIYHELGHSHYKDSALRTNSLADTLESPTYKAIEATIANYLKKANGALNSDTITGRQVKNILDSDPILCGMTPDSAYYLKTLVGRRHEQRADLFALEHLYKQNKLSAIISWINALITGDITGNIRVTATGVHPSDVERALYAIGFLADKGVDVNNIVKEWEEAGISEPITNIQEAAITDTAHSTESKFEQALTAWLQSPQETQEWRDVLLKGLDKQAPANNHEELFYIFGSVINAMFNYSASPVEGFYVQLFHMYNFLCEKQNKKPIQSLKEIDLNWVYRSYALLWQELEFPELSQDTFSDTTFYRLANFAFECLIMHEPEESFRGEPLTDETIVQGWAAYNLLREKLGQSLSPAPQAAIDLNWLKTFCSMLAKSNLTHLSKEYLKSTDPKIAYLSEVILNQKEEKNFRVERAKQLINYNILRELLKQPQAENWYEIDFTWVKQQQLSSNCCSQPDLSVLFS